jgi:DMATS type aromatic prenyltransferase
MVYRSLGDREVERFRALAGPIGFGAEDLRVAEDIFRCLLAPWADLPFGSQARYPSDVTDDHSPYEFSLAIDGVNPELRFLVEAQASKPSLSTNWEQAHAVNATLEARYGVSLERLRAIETLYTPLDRSSRFCAWHAVCFRKGKKPEFKIYLNPQAQGTQHALVIVAATLSKLGFHGADAVIAERPGDEIKYLSLDLVERVGARVKVYAAHHDASAQAIDAALRDASDYRPGQVAEFCHAMGGSYGPYDQRPVQTCLAFADGGPMPVAGTVYFPVRAYAESDLEARDRILAYLDDERASLYARALAGFAERPLQDGVGMQTYVSLRQYAGPRRVTVYLSPEVYAVQMPGSGRASGGSPPLRGSSASLPRAVDRKLFAGM